jgi:maltooligosyltrehalose trehalohydrolase
VAALAALTGRASAYCRDHRGTAQEPLSACKHGFLFQGQRYRWQKTPSCEPVLGQPQAAFVFYRENHDQVANTGVGERRHRRPWSRPAAGDDRAARAGAVDFLPVQGQEFAASTPFVYFSDPPEGGADVAAGRRKFLSQFPPLATPEAQDRFPDSGDEATYWGCRLDWSECVRNGWAARLHLVNLGENCRWMASPNPCSRRRRGSAGV